MCEMCNVYSIECTITKVIKYKTDKIKIKIQPLDGWVHPKNKGTGLFFNNCDNKKCFGVDISKAYTIPIEFESIVVNATGRVCLLEVNIDSKKDSEVYIDPEDPTQYISIALC